MSESRVVVVGGGAAGFFAAITCAEASPQTKVVLLEKGPQFLSKVRISGGGRCNVTNACNDPRELSRQYPRGGSALLGPFQRFRCADTAAWFEARGVKLTAEPDGRVFPITDSSATILECLLGSARRAGVVLSCQCGVERIQRCADGRFDLELSNGTRLESDRVMLATGGCRVPAAGSLAVSLGHALETPVPSLFTFHVATPWIRELAGVTTKRVEVAVPGLGLRETGPLLLTHTGLSGPAILRLSAWGARSLHAANYRFPLSINWLPNWQSDTLTAELSSRRNKHPARLVVNSALSPVPGRLWERLVQEAGVPRDTRWAELSRSRLHALVQSLTNTNLAVAGKTLNRDEFVTCGGVRLSEVNFQRMESKICPGLYFGGELLDIDGLTGGFNFQAAWTTGWLAGKAMASGI